MLSTRSVRIGNEETKRIWMQSMDVYPMYRRMEEEGEQENGRAGEREAAEESNKKSQELTSHFWQGRVHRFHPNQALPSFSFLPRLICFFSLHLHRSCIEILLPTVG